MTKKDNAGSSSANPADFFSDIAQELQNQVGHLNPQDAQEEASSKDDSEENPLFSTSTANTPDEDAADDAGGLFDETPASPDTDLYKTIEQAPPAQTAEAAASDVSTPEELVETDEQSALAETPSTVEEEDSSGSSMTTENKPTEQEEETSAEAATDTEAVSASEDLEASQSDADEVPPSDTEIEVEVAEAAPESEEATTPAEEAAAPVEEDPEEIPVETAPMEEQVFEGSPAQSEVEIGPHSYTLEQAIFQSNDRVVWRASRTDKSTDQLYLVEEISYQRYANGYKSMPELYQVRILRPEVIQEFEDRAFLIFRKPTGHRLKERIEDRSHRWSLDEIRHIIRTVGHSLAGIHENNKLFLQLDSRHIWMEDDKDPLLLSVERLYDQDTPFHRRPVREGFSAPEIFQKHSVLGPYTDIFALGALLHYLISHAPLFNHLDTPAPHIPSPRVYHPDFPVGLDHIIFRACHPDPGRRYQRVSQFIGAFERALRTIEERLETPKQMVQLAVGHDIHIGVSKGNRNPTNQDALFWRYDRERGKGLFVIADGVSHCNYGSGDRASSILIQAARKRWDTLLDKPIMDQDLSAEQRQKILASIVEAANLAIGREINEQFERIDGYVEDVMGSTWVAGFLDGNHMTFANLGDSRAYLKHGDAIEQITVDHDYKTVQMQVHLDLRSVATLMGGSLITRCVGAFDKDPKLKLKPRRLDIDFFEMTLIPGDIVLLCSDGLSDYAGNDEEESKLAISKMLDSYPDPRSACFWLVALANQHGGGDNISMIEIKVLG